MAFERESEGPERAGHHELRRADRSLLAVGTMACPECDAPVVPGPGGARPADALACPYCGHAGRVRDFLSLSPPARPARVAVRVLQRPRSPIATAATPSDR